MSNKKLDPVDAHVGKRIRLRRNVLRLSQEKLGEQLGVTFQQIQKYEKGINRVGASRLQALSEALNVPIPYFFEGLPLSDFNVANLHESAAQNSNFSSVDEQKELYKAFNSIPDRAVRRKIIELAKILASEQGLVGAETS